MTEVIAKRYAGIGSRETPVAVLDLINRVALRLEQLGWYLNTGGADGADAAFANGIANKRIYLPWAGYNGVTGIVIDSPLSYQLAAKYHPNWLALKQGAQKLMARNCHQVLGDDLKTPVQFVLCWTRDGADGVTVPTSIKTGGTGQAIRIAADHHIPVYNLFDKTALHRLAANFNLGQPK